MIVYAATFVDKEIETDDYDRGCIGPRSCVWHERLNVQAPSLAELIAKLSEKLDLDIDDIFIPSDESEEVDRIGYNRLENEEGYEPTAQEKKAWKLGKVTLYLADYTFAIEKYETLPIKAEEFATAGITTH